MDELNKLYHAKNVTLVSGIFCVLISLLLVLNYWQFVNNETLESKILEALVERLNTELNNDELLQEIRNLDVLAHKAYFNNQGQVKTGAYLLVLGAIVFAVALRFYNSIKSKIEKSSQQVENEFAIRLLSQKWILTAGTAIFIFALISSFATINHLNYYSVKKNQLQPTEGPADKQIEVAEIEKPAETVAEENPIEKDEIADSSNKITNKSLVEANTVQNKSTGKVEGNADVINTPESSSMSILTTEKIQNNHNSFRGPWGNGVSYNKNIPTEWDGATGKNLLWKSEIPKQGYNSPVIWEDKIFLSGGDNQAREVYCFDKNTGKLLWTKKADNIQGSPVTPPKVDENTGLAAPSVTTDGEKVFAIFATGDVIAFDVDGNRKWARNLGVPDIPYGYASSLITWTNKLFIQFDTNRGGKLLALDVTSGKTIWETAREIKTASWASPVVSEINGIKQLILTADPNVAGYDIETGKELWTIKCMMGEVVPSVAVGEGWIFAANEYARLVAIDPTDGSIKWEDDEYLPEVASPVVANGLLFIATSYGDMVCYDAKTGEKLWAQDFDSGFYSSPVIADNKVYALDLDGIMHIFEVNREAKEINSPKLGEEGSTTPTFSEGRIYIRGQKYLYCFSK